MLQIFFCVLHPLRHNKLECLSLSNIYSLSHSPAKPPCCSMRLVTYRSKSFSLCRIRPTRIYSTDSRLQQQTTQTFRLIFNSRFLFCPDFTFSCLLRIDLIKILYIGVNYLFEYKARMFITFRQLHLSLILIGKAGKLP